MARGRFLSKEISTDKSVDALSSDLSRLAFTWTIAHLDREGRITGEPLLLLRMVFPRRQDLSTEQMEACIAEWAAAGMVQWYEGPDGDRWLWFPHFEEHQQGLRKEREEVSKCPEPPPRSDSGVTPDQLRQHSGVTPEEVRHNVNVNVNGNDKVNEKSKHKLKSNTSAAAAADFKEFYSAYPRKKEPRSAERAYLKARKDGTTHEAIMAGVRILIANIKQNQTPDTFVPYPASWINAGGWADQPDSPNGHNGHHKLTPEPKISGTEEEMRERYTDDEVF